jgi:predicted kinase
MQIVVIIGAVCSGKSKYAAERYDLTNVIDIGDIVREITKTERRVHVASLDSQIMMALHAKIMSLIGFEVKEIVITGIRQFSILNYIEENFNYDIVRILLEVPIPILKKRYKNSKRAKDSGLTFEEAIERDDNIGYGALLDYVKSVNHREVENYTSEEWKTTQG